jgi:hypothetical protein
MPLNPNEQRELDRLEAAFEEAGGRGVELAERIDELRARRDSPVRRDTHILITTAIAVAVPRDLVEPAAAQLAVSPVEMGQRLVTQALEQVFSGEGATGLLVAHYHEDDIDVLFDVDDYPDAADDPIPQDWRDW